MEIWQYCKFRILLPIPQVKFSFTTMNAEVAIQILKDRPSEDQILLLCKKLKPEIFTPSPFTQNILACLLSDTLPELGSTPAAVLDLIGSLPGISAVLFNTRNLLNHLDTGEKNADDRGSNELIRQRQTKYTTVSRVKISITSQLEYLLVLLSNVLKTVPLDTIYQRAASQTQIKELNALFAGSSLYSLVSQSHMILNQHEISTNKDNSWHWMADQVEYGKYLGSSTLAFKETNSELFFKALRLLSTDYLKVFFQSAGNVRILLETFKTLRDLDQRAVLITYILPLLSRQFEQLNNGDLEITSFASLLSLFIRQGLPNTIIPQLIKFAESPAVSLLLQRTIILAVTVYHEESEKCFVALLDRWSSPLNIRHAPILVQRAQTHLLFLWLPQLPLKFLQRISTSASYLNGVSNHLSALSEDPRLFGMAFAEKVSTYIDNQVKPLNFGAMGTVNDTELAYWRDVIGSLRDAPIDTKDREEIIHQYFLQLATIANNSNTALTPRFNASSTKVDSIITGPPIPMSSKSSETSASHTEQGDSDDDDDREFKVYPFDEDDSDDSDDDPTIVNRERIRPPVYIKDLLAYINDTSETSFEKVKIALENASDLIKRKAKYGKELSIHAEELASSLVGLKLMSDDDEEENRSQYNLRLDALGVLVACDPFKVPAHLAHLLGTGDYSIMQRMVILSSITLGAHFLSRGEIGSESENFASKRLPQGLHEKFTGFSPGDKALAPFNMKQLEDVTLQVQRELTQGISEKAQGELVGGAQVLRMSSTLKKQRDNGGKTISHSSINLYAKVAAKHFFYPLLAQWTHLGSRMVGGTYNELFASHYIKTLALLVHSAYPSSGDLQAMSDELVRIVLSYRSVDEVHVQEALFTAVLTVLHVNPGELVVSKWARQVCIEIKLWLESIWESVPDAKVRGLGASALYQIQEISQKWERRLVGEMIGLESDGGRDIRIV